MKVVSIFTTERQAKAREKAEANAAVKHMAVAPATGLEPAEVPAADGYARRFGMRPLNPPTRKFAAGQIRTAAQLALAEDIRNGVVDP